MILHSLALLILAAPAFANLPDLGKLRVIPGYQIELYVKDVKGARSMTRGTKGTLFVGTRGSEVYAYRDGKLYTIAKGLTMPNGVAFKDGTLYVAEVSRIVKFEKIEDRLQNPPKPVVVYDQLPTEKHHGWKWIGFGPDGYLYVPVGAPCDICDQESKDARFATILRFKKLDGSPPEIFAKGVRNTVGFDWRPKPKELWFTDNGRDRMGDHKPADELNYAPKAGMHFGYPFCHQGDLLDPEFGHGKKCSDYTPPAFKLGPHVAALGMRFLDENTILVAEHGSWNSSQKVGYRVMKITLSGNKPIKEEVFLSGFLQPREQVIGRPVDVEVLPDHSILISDDKADSIYRVFRQKNQKEP